MMKQFFYTIIFSCVFVAASAGTGKTYNIETLYLRLLLEQELTVKQILVVTLFDKRKK